MHAHANNRIMVIDDNRAIHEDLKKILVASSTHEELDAAEALLFDEARTHCTSSSFEVDSVYQGRDGLEKVRESLAKGRPYAMAFVDVRMPPGWDGIETITRVWEVYPELQVVLCTAYADYSWEEIVAALKQPDSMVILKKPFDNIEVLQLAHALTHKWQLAQQARGQMQLLEGAVRERTQALQAANDRLTREVQERIQAEAALRLSEERFSKAFASSPVPMAILDLRGRRWVDVNASWLAMTGHVRSDFCGHAADDLRLWADDTLPRRIEEFRATGQAIRNLECRVLTRQGAHRDTLASAEIFSLGTQQHLLLILQDVSELLSLEPELEQSLKSIRGAADRASTLTRQLLSFARKQIMQPRVIASFRRPPAAPSSCSSPVARRNSWRKCAAFSTNPQPPLPTQPQPRRRPPRT